MLLIHNFEKFLLLSSVQKTNSSYQIVRLSRVKLFGNRCLTLP